MNQVDYEEIIKRAEKRRSDVKAVTEMLDQSLAHYMGLLRDVLMFTEELRERYRGTDDEGKALIMNAIYHPEMGNRHVATQDIHHRLHELGLDGCRLSDLKGALRQLNRGVNPGE